MQKISMRSIAKVNLGLHITGRLDNGYHLLETLFYPVEDLWDLVEVEAIEGEDSRVVMENFLEEVPLEKNLAWRAWKALRDAYPEQVGAVEVRLQKRIPAGAGLGGGSSNAAAMLRGVNELFGLGISLHGLAELAEPLGADVPFFVYGTPLYATGIGNRFEHLEIDLQGLELIVYPLPYHSSTVAAYRGLDLNSLQHAAPLKELLALPVAEWKGKVLNDLEGPVFDQLPEVGHQVAALYHEGAVYAAMTGSGSAVFGLFDNR